MNKLTQEEFTERAKAAEFYETDSWAAERILDHELLTRKVLDPCAGRGVLGKAAREKGYEVTEWDLNLWPGLLPGATVEGDVDFLEPISQARQRRDDAHLQPDDFTVLMNPPFSRACDFIRRSFTLGARKVVMFQRFAFLESSKRRAFFRDTPPARVWICGDRATCWRGDIPETDVVCPDTGEILVKGKKGRSAPTAHAWFIWERGHAGAMTINHLWKDG